MKKIDLIAKELTEALKMWSKFEGPMEVEKSFPPKVGEIRALNSIPTIYFLPIEEIDFYEEKLFKVLVLTEEVLLSYLGRETPILGLPSKKLLLAGLPLWIYLVKSFLEKYSYPIGLVSETECENFLKYAETTPLPETPQGVFIKKLIQILAPFNTKSILDLLDELESSSNFLLIEPDLSIFESYQEYQYLAVASSKLVYKGKNWLGLVEKCNGKARLILYLPQNLLGEKVKIYLKNKLLFEGELTSDKLIVDPLPEYMDYSFLKEDLYVQI